MIASLPMYNFSALRPANQAFWSALAGLLRAQGHRDVPDEIAPDDWRLPDVLPDELLFSQMCGYPLLTLYQGQYQMLATPSYGAPGCGPFTHAAFIVVAEHSVVRDLEGLRGRRFALNSRHSNSGMNLPRRLFAPLARDGRFLGDIIETGSHARSLEHVRDGQTDAASIDSVTWAFAQDHRPELTAGLRILAQTPESPAIPFITGPKTPPALVDGLRQALLTIGQAPEFRAVREELRLQTIGLLPSTAYAAILDHERQASAAGYGQIG